MRIFAFAGAALVLATAAHADPIADRKQNMRDRAAQLRVLGPVAQGNQPFDAAAVLAALEQLNADANATDVAALWPAGSDSGDTKSSPKIWEDMAGFTEIMDRFKAAATAAAEARPQSVEAFRDVFQPIAATCGACHQAYRL